MISSVLLIGILFFLTAGVGFGVVKYKEFIEPYIKWVLSFSGAFLLAVAVLHLLPEVYAHYSPSIGLIVLLGFSFQLILEFFSQGIEHGHFHSDSSKSSYPIGVVLSLIIHSLIEGMALDHDGHHHHHQVANTVMNFPLFVGVLVHKIPVVMILVIMLIAQNVKKSMVLLSVILFSLSAPLGYFLAKWMNDSLMEGMQYILAFALGIFIHISTTILFESTQDHRFNIKKVSLVAVGFVLAYILS